MRSLLLAVAVAALSAPAAAPAWAQAPAQAPAGTYVSDRPHTSITWKGLHNGLSWYSARFTNSEITVDFNPADPAKSKVAATIDPKSVETDFTRTRPASRTDDFNAELATGARYFNAGKFPQITFASTAVTKTGENSGKVTGDLTFLGVTKPVTLDVAYIGNRNDPRLQKHRIGFAVTGSFKRSDFGMPVGGPMGDEIKLEIHSELIQK
jgi:polyisoprenoid-binding protein YceI